MTDPYVPPKGTRVRIVEVHPESCIFLPHSKRFGAAKIGDEFVARDAYAAYDSVFSGYVIFFGFGLAHSIACRVEAVEMQADRCGECGLPWCDAVPPVEPERPRSFCECGAEAWPAKDGTPLRFCGDCRSGRGTEPIDSRIAAVQPEQEALGNAFSVPHWEEL